MAAASCPNWLLLKKRSLLDIRNAHVRKSCRHKQHRDAATACHEKEAPKVLFKTVQTVTGAEGTQCTFGCRAYVHT
jgi:hypothetical protein